MSLTAVEVLYLHYVNGKTKQEALQHGFWLTEYDSHPGHLLNQLIKTGAIYKSHNLTVTLTKFTVPIIKDLLRKSGVKVSGSKKELIERAELHAEFIDLTELTLHGVYVVTEQYEKTLQQTEFINYINFHGPLSIEDAYSYYLEHPDKSSSEIIIALHEERIAESIGISNKYDAVKCHHLLSEYYNNELKNIEDSLYHMNQFTMLIILQTVNSYLQHNNLNRLTQSYFNIDNYTVEKYRDLLRMKQITIKEIYDKLLNHAEGLPYNETHITLSAQFIIRYIIGDEAAEEKLIDSLDVTATSG